MLNPVGAIANIMSQIWRKRQKILYFHLLSKFLSEVGGEISPPPPYLQYSAMINNKL
jgi:hypothetical protein